MFLKLLIISAVIIVLIFLALGFKLWFYPDAEFTVHSCALEDGNLNEDGTCHKCQLKDLSDCPENEHTAHRDA